MLRPSLQTLCASVFVLFAAAMPAQAGLIDGFSSGLQRLQVDPEAATATSQVVASTAMGGYRNASLHLDSGNSEITMLIYKYNQLNLSFNQGVDAQGTAVITWDGDNDAGGPSLNVLNHDLTDSYTSDRIRVNLNFDDLPINMTFTAYSGSTLTDYVSQGTISLPGGIVSTSYRDLFFNAMSGSPSFAQTGTAGPADFAHVKALTLKIGGAGVTAGADVNVTKIESVPEPSTVVLAAFGLLCLGGAILRRKMRG